MYTGLQTLLWRSAVEVMAAIGQLLLAGHKPKEIIDQGYAKSTVYVVQRKLLATQLPVPGFEPGDELVELKRYKEKVKLEKEIAELEAAKEKLPERMAALEKHISFVHHLVRDLGDTLAFYVRVVGGETEDEAMKYCEGWVEDKVEPKVKS